MILLRCVRRIEGEEWISRMDKYWKEKAGRRTGYAASECQNNMTYLRYSFTCFCHRYPSALWIECMGRVSWVGLRLWASSKASSTSLQPPRVGMMWTSTLMPTWTGIWTSSPLHLMEQKLSLPNWKGKSFQPCYNILDKEYSIIVIMSLSIFVSILHGTFFRKLYFNHLQYIPSF